MEANSSFYTVLARRFRPQTFGEVVGQGMVAQALKNAIQSGRVAHAYLFTGARGVGKTSMARILAKALNCPHAANGEPCNQCDICQGISSGHDIDVLEIDGASNRGIDEIRALRANVNVKSMRTRHKMYIIDEVHMLTKDAFNALLKTLEEPPPNVKFVFCTTEPNKIPDTILSRCQRFDFGTIETANIVARLAQIAESEGYQVEPEALELVARRAAGSMRDSQSLFDQLLAFGEEKLTAADVHRLLGTAGDDRLIEIVDSLVERQGHAALVSLDRALADGVQLGELVDQLLNYVRDLMVLGAGAEGVGLLAVSEPRRSTLADQAQRWGLPTIVAALQILSDTKTRMFRTTSARAIAEMALVRISLLEDLEELGQLIRELREGKPAGETARPPGGAAAPRRPNFLPVRGEPRPSAGASLPAPGPRETAGVAAPAATSPGEGGARLERASSAVSAPSRLESVEPARVESDEPAGDESEEPASVAAEVPAGPIIEFARGRESEIWAEVVSQIQDMLRDHVRYVVRTAIIGPNQLELIFPRSYHFHKEYCERNDARTRLEGLLKGVTGQNVTISCRLTEDETPPAGGTKGPSRVAKEAANGGESTNRRNLESTGDPFVEQARAIFGGTVVRRGVAASSSEGES